VGSIAESVIDGVTGFLTRPHEVEPVAERLAQLLADRDLAAEMGAAGRQCVVEHWSLERMVDGYADLITGIYTAKAGGSRSSAASAEQVVTR
jgi:phosphatidylinositol alpha-1,6-mannosyltransferase